MKSNQLPVKFKFFKLKAAFGRFFFGANMSCLKVDILPPSNAAINSVLGEIERKYAGKPATPEMIADIEREAARLIRRLIITKVTFVRN
ncbi:hypothetical protein [Pantoea ananatis]|nr:hypothetical protein [Pantoea ananatis]